MEGTVRFALVDTNGKVVFDDELVLERDETHNIWMARWEGKLNLVTTANLVFDFSPAESASDA